MSLNSTRYQVDRQHFFTGIYSFPLQIRMIFHLREAWCKSSWHQLICQLSFSRVWNRRGNGFRHFRRMVMLPACLLHISSETDPFYANEVRVCIGLELSPKFITPLQRTMNLLRMCLELDRESVMQFHANSFWIFRSASSESHGHFSSLNLAMALPGRKQQCK